jgi:hypothetical protein
MSEKVYLMRCKVKRLGKQVENLLKKASKQHLGGQEDANLKKLIQDHGNAARRLKQEVLKERTEKRDGKT